MNDSGTAYTSFNQLGALKTGAMSSAMSYYAHMILRAIQRNDMRSANTNISLLWSSGDG
jgi:hypothetical protein